MFNFHDVLSLQAMSQISLILINQILKYVFTCTMQDRCKGQPATHIHGGFNEINSMLFFYINELG